jgi:hypothetical protein
MSNKIVQRIYVKLSPETGKVIFSCTIMEESMAVYVANYPGTQAELKEDFDNHLNRQL